MLNTPLKNYVEYSTPDGLEQSLRYRRQALLKTCYQMSRLSAVQLNEVVPLKKQWRTLNRLLRMFFNVPASIFYCVGNSTKSKGVSLFPESNRKAEYPLFASRLNGGSSVITSFVSESLTSNKTVIGNKPR